MKGPWFPYFQAPQSFSMAGLKHLVALTCKYVTVCYIKTVGWKTEKAATPRKSFDPLYCFLFCHLIINPSL
jgi:hypothetical protein